MEDVFEEFSDEDIIMDPSMIEGVLDEEEEGTDGMLMNIEQTSREKALKMIEEDEKQETMKRLPRKVCLVPYQGWARIFIQRKLVHYFSYV